MELHLNNRSVNPINIADTPTEGPFIATLSTILPSLTGFQGWLTLFLICCAFEMCRRATFQAWDSILASFWTTIDLEGDSRSYDWMMLWLSQHPTFKNAGRFAISDSAPGMKAAAAGDLDDPGNVRIAHLLLAYNHMYSFWHKGRYFKVQRFKGEISFHSTDSLQISILGGGHQTVDALLREAKECWKKANEERVSVYASDLENRWDLISSHPRRLLGSVILDGDIKEDLLEDVHDFLSSKKWYSQRGIPFRRGYLLHGAPGSGKTSLIQSIAGELKLDVYILSLSRMGLTDNGLRELTTKLPERCIALMEDIDVAFHQNRELLSGTGSPEGTKGTKLAEDGVSLSGLLNALDGVGAQEGRIIFATTNQYEALDPALRRPGRIDHIVEFKLASQYQFGELFKRFYLPTTSKDEGENRRTSNPGHRTPVEPRTEVLLDAESPMGMQDQPLAALAHRKKREVEVSPEELDVLVERFREAIPEREFSMAALQGYLLMHKTQPRRAVECARKWVGEEMAKRTSG